MLLIPGLELTGCGACNEAQPVEITNSIPTIKLGTATLPRVEDGGLIDGGQAMDGGCFLEFRAELGPLGVEGGAEAISSGGLIGGWLNIDNTVLPAFWYSDGGVALTFRSQLLIAGRIWSFSEETGVGEALVRGMPLQAALFDLDGGMQLLGSPISVARSGTPAYVGGDSASRVAIWTRREGLAARGVNGSILGGDGDSSFVGRQDSANGSSAVIIRNDGGIATLPTSARNAAGRGAALGTVVGYVDGFGDIVPVRWPSQVAELVRLPSNLPFGGATFVDGTGSISGSVWGTNPNELPRAAAWTPGGRIIEVIETSVSALRFTGSRVEGEVVGHCIVNGLTKGCVYRRRGECSL